MFLKSLREVMTTPQGPRANFDIGRRVANFFLVHVLTSAVDGNTGPITVSVFRSSVDPSSRLAVLDPL